MIRMRNKLLLILGVVIFSAAAAAFVAFKASAFHATDQFAVASSHAKSAKFVQACGSTSARLAQTTPGGGSVFIGQAAAAGSYCVVYQDANGTTVQTVGPVGGTPAGAGLVLKALDTATNKYVLVIALPDSVSLATVNGVARPITNNVLVLDASQAPALLPVSGAAGSERVDLSDFLH